jgi:hypothetical protein
LSKLSELKAYKILQEEELPEVNGRGYVLCHEKTKARVMVIENDDDNKVFTIGFRTPPHDDSGIPHILEHSVLCGSRKYPVKDPFVELAKGSLNTFLNAMTYSDKTVYPVASCNTTDFENLMMVYLDAVFYPNIYDNHKIMRQEGWHYELENADDELTINGVVYNEMKGVFSSAEQQMYRAIETSLLADTPYGKESGGDPEAIPTLTQQQFEEFHRTYYHPSNSYIYLYGDCDMAKELDYIDKEYLSNFEYKDIDSAISLQKPFEEVKEVTKYYSIADNEGEENNTFLAYSMVIGSSLDKKQVTAMSILEYAIMDAPGAPLKKAIVDAGIGEDVFSSFDSGIQQTSFSVIAKNANPEDKDRFVQIVRDTLTKLAGRGEDKAEAIDKKSLEAAINNFEFKHKEANFGRYPKGLMLGLDAFNSWLYDDSSALTYFKLNEVYDELKKELETDYFEQLIWDRLVDNTFGAVIMMLPKKGLDREADDKLQKKLADYKALLNEDEIQKIVLETQALKQYQEEPSPAEELAKVPLLNISDIDKEAKKLKNRLSDIYGIPVVSQKIFTNGIGYLEFLFNINDLDVEYLPYAALLTEIFKYVDTDNNSYSQLSNEINFHTGGISFTTGIFNKVHGEQDDYVSYFSVKTKAVYEKLDIAINLIKEILYTSKLEDKKRLKEIIAETKAGLKTELTSSGHVTTATRAMSYISKVAAFKDTTEGIDFYNFLVELDSHFEEKSDDIVDNLKTTLAEILRKGALTIGYTGEDDINDELAAQIEAFGRTLSTRPAHTNVKTFDISIKNEGFKTASQVQYVAVAGDFTQGGYEYTGALSVLQVIMSYGYLWENVRVKGGAYGAMCSFGRSGISYMTSYRDPNLMETYNIYKDTYKYVESFDADDRDMTKYLIGTIAKLDTPMTPSAEGSFNFVSYLAGVTDEDLQKERDEILATDVQTIRKLAPMIKQITDSGIICAVGGEDKIEGARDNLSEIRNL